MALGSHLITVRRLEKYINDVIGKKANLPDTSKTIIGNISQINSNLLDNIKKTTKNTEDIQTIAGSQIPQSTVANAVNNYVSEHSAGFATKTELTEVYDTIENEKSATKIIKTKNLFDKNNVIHGKYIDKDNGGMPSLANYNVFLCNVKPNTTYIRKNDSLGNSAFYDADMHYIGTSVDEVVMTPSNCKYFGISVSDDNLNVATINEGSKAYDYDTNTLVLRNVLEVGENSLYTSIQSAVNDAEDGDIIYIHNGIYHESVKNRYKYLHFVGESKEHCIVEYENGNYANPPFEIAKGSMRNLTVHCIAQSQQSGAIAKAYCVHIDWQVSIDSNLYIENVKFINDDYQVVGIGLQTGFVLEFVNCEFVTGGNTNAFYCHTMDNANAGNQYLTVRNCTFINNGSEYTVHMQSQEEPNAYAECIWQRNIVVNRGVSNRLIDMAIYDKGLQKNNWLGSTDWHLSEVSLMNNVAEMNKQ